ncbi:hypothetical protein S-CBS4_gp081 [Synechococcus phage S-CBS4]|uniref:hypothetical protein n=1 Tax=Synechococcus phage S-CBS4 TaxID=756275 RepID=UPI000246A729|nr:hypothetical protein S-CBS4_gp081 [Synechococcus phage S-CBS4]AEX56048.1 hypothetical protein S-CBS4_gp081 [Synechococcus phage S-CBS4]
MVEALLPGVVREGGASFPYGSGANETLQRLTVGLSRFVGDVAQVSKSGVGEGDVATLFKFAMSIRHSNQRWVSRK